MAKLLAGMWEYSLTTAAMIETHRNPENLGIRWDLDAFGIDRIQYRIRTRSKLDLHNRLKNDLGKRAGVYTHWGLRPITGFIINVDDAGAGRVQYDIRGPGVSRMQDEYEKTIFASATTLSSVIASTLTNHVAIASSKNTVIATNATTIGGSAPRLPVGAYPDEWILEILGKSDSSNNRYDFWFVDEMFSNLKLQLWIPYYQARGASISPLWNIWERDTVDGFQITRSINDIRTNVTIYYGTITGTVTGADATGFTLTDSAATFRTNGVQPGDRVVNITDGSSAKVESVTSQTVLVCSGLSGGTDDQWDSSDAYALRLTDPLSSSNNTKAATYWSRATAEYKPDMTATQAAQYRELLLNEGDAEQVSPFTLGSRFVRKAGGGLWPLWEMIAQGGGYVRLMDLYPAASQLTASLNKLTIFKVTSLDYDHDSNQLRVGIDRPDRRLDARLKRARVLDGTFIQRGRSYR